ncbi:competence protein CoiA family protein [Klebsiella oxytoca]
MGGRVVDYAINEASGKLVSASQALRYSRYICPVCKKGVSLRRGKIIPPYFAHFRGYGTLDCENFVPAHLSFTTKENINDIVKRRMELRLLISTAKKIREWSLELALPTCNLCQAKVILDVGGRSQTIDMRGMVTRRQISAELSARPYRIVSFTGNPDPEFVREVERECPGLPSVGAAVFTAMGGGASNGFPLAQELRCTETFAFLWREPASPGFPDELDIDSLVSRQGWNLAIVTIPETLSPESISWLNSFTHLPIVPAKSSITAIWPFQTQDISINQVECIHSNFLLLSANMISTPPNETGPTMCAQGASSVLSAIGVEKSPAFFTLTPDNSDIVGVSASNDQDIKKYYSFFTNKIKNHKYPSVDLVYTKKNGVREIVSLHQRRCVELTMEARQLGYKLEYLSMPSGAEGTAKIQREIDISRINLFSSDHMAPHDSNMRLLRSDAFSKLSQCLSDVNYNLDIEFKGLGELHLAGFNKLGKDIVISNEISSSLRLRILSFILQMQSINNEVVMVNDSKLLEVLEKLNPKQHLLPHYRALVKEVIASGFEFNRFR